MSVVSLAGEANVAATLGFELPDAEEREALVVALADLCARSGGDPLRTRPLEPHPRWFPDRWDGTMAGAELLAGRLLAYAGLSELNAVVEEGAGDEEVPDAVAWFLGIAQGEARFAVDPRLLQDPVAAAGVLAHEVAHAFRSHRGLCDPDPDREELLTDATTVYLGFGILTVNATWRFQTGGSSAAGGQLHPVHGYLSPGTMAFLLAAQVVGQGASRGARRNVERLLETNQARTFGAACRLLARDAPALRRRLGFPADVRPLERRPPPPSLSPQTGAPLDVRHAPDNAGRKVFRVPRSRLDAFGAGFGAALVPMLTLAMAVGFAANDPAVAARAPGLLWASAIASGVFGLAVGVRRLRKGGFDCSDPACRGSPGPLDASCPACHGEIAGTIRHQNERLAAAEALSGDVPGDEDGDAGIGGKG